MRDYRNRVDSLPNAGLLASVDCYLEKRIGRIAKRIYGMYPLSLVHGPAHARGVARLTAYLLRSEYPHERIGLARPLVAALAHDTGHQIFPRSGEGPMAWESRPSDMSEASEEHALESCRSAASVLREEGYAGWGRSEEIFAPILLHPRRAEIEGISDRLRSLQRELYLPESDVTSRSIMISFALKDADKIERYSYGPPVVQHAIDHMFGALVRGGEASFEDSVPRMEEHLRGIRFMSGMQTYAAREIARCWNSDDRQPDRREMVGRLVYSNHGIVRRVFDAFDGPSGAPHWDAEAREFDGYVGRISDLLERNSGEVEGYVERARGLVDEALSRGGPTADLRLKKTR